MSIESLTQRAERLKVGSDYGLNKDGYAFRERVLALLAEPEGDLGRDKYWLSRVGSAIACYEVGEPQAARLVARGLIEEAEAALDKAQGARPADDPWYFFDWDYADGARL